MDVIRSIDIKHIDRKIWRVRFSISDNGMNDILLRVNWCIEQFGPPSNITPKRWEYIKDSVSLHRFWFYEEDDYIAFNLTWLNQ